MAHFRGKDYYEILDVKRDCKASDIKNSFIKLSKIYHPDKNSNSKEAKENFIHVNEAYATLSNPNKRREYDQLLAYGRKTVFTEYPRTRTYDDRVPEWGNRTGFHGSGKSGTGANFFIRHALFPNLTVLAVFIIFVATGGLRLCLLESSWKTSREKMEERSRLINLIHKYTKERAQIQGFEKQLENLRDGKLKGITVKEVMEEQQRRYGKD